jgi:hypothetical protein
VGVLGVGVYFQGREKVVPIMGIWWGKLKKVFRDFEDLDYSGVKG